MTPVAVETTGEDAPTRKRVALSILEHGPSTAVTLAQRLELTAAGIRRHLEHLVNDGLIQAKAHRVMGERRRGRPAQMYELTPLGRERFANNYDSLARELLVFLSETRGDEAVFAFAKHRWESRRDHYLELVEGLPENEIVPTLAQALSEDGYPSSVIHGAGGEQICQHHCPIANVAQEFPQLCEAETQFLSELLGSHVQRLATIAHGDGVCTTHVPHINEVSALKRTTPTPERLSS
ncbi:MAG: transcriptional regulator [Aeromicrobium sp.]|nr:MAG: transcriptional regulator [Aeromicrobium sp.]